MIRIPISLTNCLVLILVFGINICTQKEKKPEVEDEIKQKREPLHAVKNSANDIKSMKMGDYLIVEQPNKKYRVYHVLGHAYMCEVLNVDGVFYKVEKVELGPNKVFRVVGDNRWVQRFDHDYVLEIAEIGEAFSSIVDAETAINEIANREKDPKVHLLDLEGRSWLRLESVIRLEP
jgi:hypothetical protein